jgi:hypothetical protein
VTAEGTTKGKHKGQQAMVFVYTRIWVKRDDLSLTVAAPANLLR